MREEDKNSWSVTEIMLLMVQQALMNVLYFSKLYIQVLSYSLYKNKFLG